MHRLQLSLWLWGIHFLAFYACLHRAGRGDERQNWALEVLCFLAFLDLLMIQILRWQFITSDKKTFSLWCFWEFCEIWVACEGDDRFFVMARNPLVIPDSLSSAFQQSLDTFLVALLGPQLSFSAPFCADWRLPVQVPLLAHGRQAQAARQWEASVVGALKSTDKPKPADFSWFCA